jgi:imidazolonepropionase-like amidohydrolase
MKIQWLASIVVATAYSQPNAVLYEGERLIIGDQSPAIESGALLIQNGRITAVGQKGSVKAPSGAARIDLTGKTVMPTLNNVHIHIGYEGYTR